MKLCDHQNITIDVSGPVLGVPFDSLEQVSLHWSRALITVSNIIMLTTISSKLFHRQQQRH